MSLVNVEGLRVGFDGVEVVHDVSLSLAPGECVAIVGESGSGKSVTARSLLGLAGPGSTVEAELFEIDGRDALAFGRQEWRRLRGRFAGLVLQDALVSLDPLRTVGAEVAEVLRVHDVVPRARRTERVLDLLEQVGIPDPAARIGQRPHQLSGGLRQRVLIASAIAAEPALIIADEPTTALDVTVQAQILRLLAERKAAGTALLLISHDLAVVSSLADRVLVMKDGRLAGEGAGLAPPPHAVSRPAPDYAAPVLTASNLSLRYGSRHALDDVSLTLHRGETVGVVGESGSGKTTLARLLLGLAEPDTGRIALHGRQWSHLPERARRPWRSTIQIVSQSPLDSFDPRHTVGRLLAEPLADLPGPEREPRALDLLERVGLPATVADRHPRQLSGGQRQRVAIARALANRPDVLVCDEPVSALDVSIQAQVLDLLADLQTEYGTAMVFVSHDLGVVHRLADRVMVMKEGRVVEEGEADEVFLRPRHPYTEELVAAVPGLPIG
ncbi:ABC transporter ATP-binding protein [Nonomuraea sp. NPDC049152]|uniref:ABC transporter ATP-binding protein n=1 Tax=Nonomuraea sp. NPDC049152 TaxID=3154350 RepID=UPI0033E095F5